MKDAQADVIVIGGGVIGLCVAYYATLKGATVVILERGDIGSGSSSGNAGLVVPSQLDPLPAPGMIREGLRGIRATEGFFGIRPQLNPAFLHWLFRFSMFCSQKHYRSAITIAKRLNPEALRAHLELARLGGREYNFEQRGLLFLFLTSKRLAHAQAKAAEASAAGLECRLLSREEVREVEPAAKGKIVGGIHYLSDAGLQPLLFLDWLAGQAVARGARIMTQTEVYGFRTHRGRLKTVQTTRGDYEADQVVLAAGAWLRPLGRLLGARLPIEGGKGISLTFPSPAVTVRQPLILDEYHVAVSPIEQALRITGVLELAGLDLTLNPDRVRGVQQSAARYLPMFEQMKSAEIWRGLRPCTPDGLPLLGRLPPFANVLVAGGHATKGIFLGPLTGQYVARLLAGESLGYLEKSLSPARF